MADEAQKAQIMAEFQALDTDNDGFLFFQEIQKALEAKRGIPFTDNDMIALRNVFKAADANHDEKISPEEFLAFKLSPMGQNM